MNINYAFKNKNGGHGSSPAKVEKEKGFKSNRFGEEKKKSGVVKGESAYWGSAAAMATTKNVMWHQDRCKICKNFA